MKTNDIRGCLLLIATVIASSINSQSNSWADLAPEPISGYWNEPIKQFGPGSDWQSNGR